MRNHESWSWEFCIPVWIKSFICGLCIGAIVGLILLMIDVALAHADPLMPDQEAEAKKIDRAQEILKQEELRRRNYDNTRSLIVSIRPRHELAELNFLAQMADRDRTGHTTEARLDETGRVFLTWRLAHLKAVVLLDRLYGQRSGDEENVTRNEELLENLTNTLAEVTASSNLIRDFIDTQFKTLPRAKRWETWEAKLCESGTNYDFEDLAYKVVSRKSPLNVMATAIEADILKKEDIRGLDGFGPLFVKMLFKINLGEKSDPALNAQYDALYNNWYHALLSLPQSERWQKWADGMEWPDTTEGQRVLARLIEEEEKARAEKK